ncbi:hypothetical protein BN7_2753 [Wickerhamomyces ciferrii]|uniref:Uncharacterized protein n=1 Tax=Wickerhamomyces ciferrii (strain ATCC 14091 / BCRC 22168 / CBS 111 / JCM 3599 / NBRC 0793 / NRRL Y-1031 F-60-10) TaxID=1206466 RepID=K0KJS8_WICCF|nr:uncharacterized protein BN7_2753 [Wickerhamomyces ciferrii]CCH43206.1 hypothetical protein BN7_2753 [Wickerhamomyces ciferrii]
MSESILHKLPHELQLKILDLMKRPEDKVNYLNCMPSMFRRECLKEIRVITDHKGINSYSTLPTECVNIWTELLNNNNFINSLSQFRGLIIFDIDIDIDNLMRPKGVESLALLVRHLSIWSKYKKSFTMVINLWYAGIFTPIYESINWFFSALSSFPNGVITYLNIPFARSVSLSGWLFEILEPSNYLHFCTIRSSNKKDFELKSKFPNVNVLRLKDLEKDFSFDQSIPLPCHINISGTCKAQLSFNSEMFKNIITFAFMDDSSLDETGIVSMDNIDAPQLRELVISGSATLDSITNFKATNLGLLEISPYQMPGLLLVNFLCPKALYSELLDRYGPTM